MGVASERCPEVLSLPEASFVVVGPGRTVVGELLTAKPTCQQCGQRGCRVCRWRLVKKLLQARVRLSQEAFFESVSNAEIVPARTASEEVDGVSLFVEFELWFPIFQDVGVVVECRSHD